MYGLFRVRGPTQNVKKLTKIEAKINSRIGKAISDHDLISNGDRILVAVSGGKDSLTLLRMLKKIQSWAPVYFSIFAAHITTDFSCSGCVGHEHLTGVFNSIGVEYFFSHVDVLDQEGKTNCFWCSWNKRKALFELAEKNLCNKVAFGHHKDDIVETLLMNLLFKGEISSMNPSQKLFEGKLTLIRPLCYVDEKLIKSYARQAGIPFQSCQCPFGKNSKRKAVKDILSKIEQATPGTNVKTNVFNSVTRIRKDYIGAKAKAPKFDSNLLAAASPPPENN